MPTIENEARTHNSSYKKLAVQWLNEAFPLRRDRSCFVSSFVVADPARAGLRNRQLLVAANRQDVKKLRFSES